MQVLIGVLLAGFPLVVIELLVRRRKIEPEVSRKLSHVLSSLAVLSLTLFCSLNQIAFIALLFSVFMLSVRHMRIWSSLYRVKRESWGEITFPLGILVASFCLSQVSAFVIIILVVGLADTAASLIGQRYGMRKLAFNSSKSYVGSLGFFICALTIIIVGAGSFSLALICLAIILTLVEGISSRGLDNLTIPLTFVVFTSIANLTFAA